MTRQSFRSFCLQNDRADLLEQWDCVRNPGVTPDDVTPGSHTRIWWRCSLGHTWEAPVYSRTGSIHECPYCSRKRVWPGTDLASRHPDLAAQWDTAKNGALCPDQVLDGSHKKVWWKCEKGHEWQTTVKSRTEGCGCPVCANRVIMPGFNDLATTHPLLTKEWNKEKNANLTPQEVGAGTTKKVWWRCHKGHEWQASINSRARGAGCPICSGRTIVQGENDFATAFPTLARQWGYEKNGELLPGQVSPYSNRSVWWRCDLGHEWKASIAHRTFSNGGCPYCAGKCVLPGFNDLESQMPEIAAQWHPTLNGTLTPAMVTVGSGKRVWWKCSSGHAWRAVIYSRTGKQKCGCPVCAGKIKEPVEN